MDVPFTTNSVAETLELGRRLGEHLPTKAIVLLEGEMGAGKTHFAKGLFLGVGGDDADCVVSPTYTLVNAHELTTGCPFFHIDLYRLETVDALVAMELSEYFFLDEGFTVVEWPRDIVEAMGLAGHILVTMTPADAPTHRKIVLSSEDDTLSAAIEGLRT